MRICLLLRLVGIYTTVMCLALFIREDFAVSVVVDEIVDLFAQRGDSQYGHEAVTQREHALQCGWLAEQAEVSSELIVAALLHDVGHLLHDLPADAPDRGLDDRHETSGYHFLRKRFGPAVSEPVRLHVAAKRYLCTVEPAYRQQLSEPSLVSLRLQGDQMSEAEQQEFRENPHAEAALQLRRWDDSAKVALRITPDISHFRPHLEAALHTDR